MLINMRTEKEITDRIDSLIDQRDSIYSGRTSYDRFMRTALNNRINELNWVLGSD